MIAVLGGLSGVVLVLGLFVLASGLVPSAPAVSTGSSTGLWTRGRGWWRQRTPADRRLWVIGLLGGLAAFLVTRWAVSLIVAPVVVAVVPGLLRTPPNVELFTLEALDRWVRLLTGSLPTGKSIPDAIRSTARQAPTRLAGPVGLLVARLNDRWRAGDALRAFADDLATADADAVVAALILATDRGGRGATETLHELAESVQERIRALREIEAEREKPRIVVRQVTGITVVVVAAVAVINPGYFSALSSPFGQLIVLSCLGVELGSLVLLRRRASPPPRERLLSPTAA